MVDHRALGIMASYMILMFYMVVAGWTLEYLIQSISGHLYDGLTAAADSTATSHRA